MKLNLDEITFVIVTYKSESVIRQCLDTLPKQSKKIIVENSGNINLEKELKIKYDNIEVIMSKNNGMGAGNNIGLKSCKTNYAYVLNPDTKLNKDTLSKLFEELDKITDFTLASPINDNPKIPNFKQSEINENNIDILSVDRIDGFSMLFNLKKFPERLFFDENFFLYLENDDLCLRVKRKGELIFIIKNSLISHLGGISKNDKLEFLRNWHWMWSKFYFNKKNFSFLKALAVITPNVLSSFLKYIFYSIFKSSFKRKIYEMRLLGSINSIIGKKSFLRLENIKTR